MLPQMAFIPQNGLLARSNEHATFQSATCIPGRRIVASITPHASSNITRRAALQKLTEIAASIAAGMLLPCLPNELSLAMDMTSDTASETVLTTDVIVGKGESPRQGQVIKVHYTLTLDGFEGSGGRVVDSSHSRGRPFRYNFMGGQTIIGWDQGVAGMHVGGRRHIVVPPSLGYGSRAVGPIPANSTLYFDIELLGINS